MSESLEELMARDLARQLDEITALHVRIARLERELAVVRRQRNDEVRLREELSSELWDREQEVLDLSKQLAKSRTADAQRTATDVLFPGAA